MERTDGERFKIFIRSMKQAGCSDSYVLQQWKLLEDGVTGIEIGDPALVAYEAANRE